MQGLTQGGGVKWVASHPPLLVPGVVYWSAIASGPSLSATIV